MFQIGDIVTIHIPEDMISCAAIGQYDGKQGRIARLCHGAGSNHGYSELEGVVSDSGIPFSFLNEWLLKVN